jgi:hypothetical protein
LRIKFFQHLDCALGIHAIGDKLFAASENGDIKCCSDLTQIFVDRAAQVSQPVVIDRVRRKKSRICRRIFQWDVLTVE